MRDGTSGVLVVRRPKSVVARQSGWTSRLVLLVALAFGVLSPYRVSPRAAESEEVESCGDSAESEATHARANNRHARRALKRGPPAQADLALARATMHGRISASLLAHPRWQLPRRSNPPDEDPLG